MSFTHRQAGTSWDAPFTRMQRTSDGKLVPITDAEWAEYEWYDITSLDDPTGVHVFIVLPPVTEAL